MMDFMKEVFYWMNGQEYIYLPHKKQWRWFEGYLKIPKTVTDEKMIRRLNKIRAIDEL